MVIANWSGAYPNLCSGEWTLSVNDKNISDKIPPYLRNAEMNTAGTYQSWHFENWLEIFEDYEDGFNCEDWIEENDSWLSDITTDYSIKEEIFNAIQSQDWRHGSCGGCI